MTDPSAIIEICWGAAYQWICYGCDRRYGKHPQTHTGVARYLRQLGDSWASDTWANMESMRIGGFYGTQNTTAQADRAKQFLGEFRRWATSS